MNTALHALGRRAKALLLRTRTRYFVDSAWRKRHRKVLSRHPEYGQPCPREVEKEHLRLWKPLRSRVKLDTLRICYNLTGVADPRMVPEEIYAAEIEPSLNRHEMVRFLANKSVYNRWTKNGVFPAAYLHNVDGRFYDGQYQPVEAAEVSSVVGALDYPVVAKPNMDTSGGEGIAFPSGPEELNGWMKGRRNFVVQEKMEQHPFFARFGGRGLNTLKVITYRSPVTNEVHVLSAAMRMSMGGGLDNETAGGLVRAADSEGRLNGYAVDKYAGRYEGHEDSGIALQAGEAVPDYDRLCRLLRRVGDGLFLARLAGFDVCMDADGNWRIIEINLRSQPPRFAQYGGYPLFGEFTEEVIEYCRENPRWC